jgi:AraC-like DNA-binding protein
LRTFPDACTGISVVVNGSAAPQCFLIGPRLAPVEGMPTIGRSLFGVRLKPGVAFLVTGVPAHTFVETRRLLSEILPAESRLFAQRLASATRLDDYFDALEALLVARIAGRAIHAHVKKALALIEESGGQMRIAEVARRCQISTHQLAHTLHTWVGLSPKTLARITRFQRFLEQVESNPSESSASRAADLGYFDQAHFTREVAQFFGATPGRLSPRQVADFSKTRCG